MKRKKRYLRFFKFLLLRILPYIIALILIGFIFPPAIRYAYLERGYKAYGGEWLIPVFILVVATIADDTITSKKKRKDDLR